MRGKLVVAGVVAALVIVQFGVVPSEVAADAGDGVPPADLLGGAGRLSGATDRLSAVEARFADVPALPDELQRIVDGAYELHTVVVNAGDTVTYTNTVVTITDDWQVFGAVEFIDTEVVFAGNHIVTVEGTGSFLMSGSSSMHDLDNDRFTGGTIRATGTLDIQGTPGTRIPIRSTTVISLPRGSNDFAASEVRYVDFKDSLAGLASSNSVGVYEFNTFTNNDRGVIVLQRASTTGAGNPTIRHSAFVGNTFGVFVQGPVSASAPSGAGKGLIQNNEFQANGFGVRCAGAPADGNTPRILSNNFRNHYLEAYGGTVGVSVTVGTNTVALIADSECTVDGNFFAGGETTWTGGKDTITNNQGAAVPNNAPASPLTPLVITASQTLNDPTFNQPVIIDNSGTLTLTGTVNANGYLWGSGTGGTLHANDVEILNNGLLLIRNDNDQADGLEIDGPSQRLAFFGFAGAPTLHILSYRNSADFSGWQASHFHSLAVFTGGLSADANVYTPSLSDAVLSDGVIPLFGAAVQLTVQDSTITHMTNQVARAQVGTLTLNGNAFSLNEDPTLDAAGKIHGLGVINQVAATGNTFTGGQFGLTAQLAALSSSGNAYHGMMIPLQQALNSLSSTNDEIDGAYIGINTQQASVTVTGAMISQSNYGVFTVLDASFSIAGSTFAYNGYGVLNAITPSVTVSNSNFRDNYQYALFAAAIALEDETLSAAAITCTNCFFFRPDDRSWNQGGGTITVTEAAVANAAPSPPWLGSVVIADAGDANPGNDIVALGSGTLAAPAIARAGGRLLVEGATVDGQDRFVFGAKAAGNGGGNPGHLTLENSAVVDVPFVAVRSTQSTIRNNVFSSTEQQLELTHTGLTVECNRFDQVGTAVAWQRQAPGAQALTFQRNLVTNPQLFNQVLFVPDQFNPLGVQLGLDDTDTNAASIHENSVLASSTREFVDRWTPGHVEMHGNNLMLPTGLIEDNFFPLASNPPDQVNAENNWWNHVTGPTVSNNPGGSGASILMAPAFKPVAVPDWDPFLVAPNVLPLCTGFNFLPASPTEVDAVTFRDLSFSPAGASITQRVWNFGDGSALETTTTDTITHDFLDGGTTVTVGVESADGQTGSASRSISVAHVAPVSNFDAVIVDETEPVQFLDTSTHPNPGDAPPAGWAYAWDFDNDGVVDSTLRNPSFEYADGGSRTVVLTVTDNDAMSNSKTVGINVPHVAPVAAFTFAPAAPLETDVVQFTSTSVHPNAPTDSVSHSWACSDGFASTAPNPSHKFADGGSYACTLTVSDNDGLSDAASQTISVAHVAPLADYVFSPAAPNEANTVQFTSTSSHPNAPTDSVAHAWSCTDGFASTATNPGHKFADGGTYTCTLTVTDNDGQSDDETKNLVVSSLSPSAAFTFTVVSPGLVDFNDASTHPNPDDAPPVGWAYAWDFDDDAVVDATVRDPPAFDYGVEEGVFTACLTATDNDGNAGTACESIDVAIQNTPPTADFGVAPPIGVVGASSKFTDASSDPDPGSAITQIVVDFGDASPPVVVAGSNVQGSEVSHAYAAAGDYTVAWTVTDDRGAVDSDSIEYHVCQPPGAGVTVGPGLQVQVEVCLSA